MNTGLNSRECAVASIATRQDTAWIDCNEGRGDPESVNASRVALGLAPLAEAFTGLRYELPLQQYHADETAVSKTQLDDVERSPHIFFERHRAADRPPRAAPTPAMFAGTLAHCAILEPDAFDARYPCGPEVDTRAAKVWKDFAASLGAHQVGIKPSERAAAFAQAAAVRRVRPLAELLEQGHAEVSAYWRDAASGVRCRCRPDWVHRSGGGVILVDVKTAGNADPREFGRSILNWNYHVQAAFYSDGYEAASGLSVHGFIFAACEKEWPYAAAACMLGEEDLEMGRRRYRRNLATIAECQRTGEWPGWGDNVHLLQLPAWAPKE